MLSDEGIVGLIKDGVIEGAVEENVGPVSYDLVTRSFYDRTGLHQSFDLAPGDSVFVACEEVINLPSDLSARVLLRNSRIRQGLSLDAPVYFPGHRTRVFFRVTNVSARSINLNRSKGIAQIVFDRVDGTVMHPYSGAFSDEFDFPVWRVTKMCIRARCANSIEKRTRSRAWRSASMSARLLCLRSLQPSSRW